uniref:Uncharacterized protein n=1 Tax=Lactuca sativa TaxID=4236 RepID=A0A9R1VS07_LACSA|nr:hypothetical protein LSAT_V11C400163020 [Lactuca sativa]
MILVSGDNIVGNNNIRLNIKNNSVDGNYKLNINFGKTYTFDYRFVPDCDNFESDRFQLYRMLNNLENLIHSTIDDVGVHDDKDIEEEKKASLEREMFLIKERISVMESYSGYLKHTEMTLQKGDE